MDQTASTRPFMETFVIELEQSIPTAESEGMYDVEEITLDVGNDPFSRLEKGGSDDPQSFIQY